ncbi:apoptosis-associated speck-like protein containing a CARD isoform X3 [Epinephelus fuscoguttatus]|uniref:apoptosis-associated speck-like protein containing a CARD isoform X3 n=1 Tax=Epinephelus fuscoguttatus TaxID=293821 RepID=UPI0020D06F88|nr:apoptosis-associated speck-like protein containing a CARD isoform X3 [Epinephelus fuscoguttatus]
MPRNIRMALADMLEDLSKENFDKFCRQLLDCTEGPRVRRNRVEGKNYLDIADVLVTTYTESRAVGVAETLLREIGCNEDAERLVEDAGRQSTKPGPSNTASPSAGASGAHAMAEGRHFVDKHRSRLIDRVCETASVLDALLENEVIQQGTYDEILAIPTHRDRMRKLFSGPLNSAGDVGKDILLNILKEKEKYLIDELMGKK